jgi:hypothetical protein
MLTTSKACKDVDNDHIAKKGLLHWDVATGQRIIQGTASQTQKTVETPSETATAGPSTTAPVKVTGLRRFQDAAGKPILITGFDIIGLFHMTEQQLKQRGVSPYLRERFRKQYRTDTYVLKDVYDAAVVIGGCPIDNTPDWAVERFRTKLQKCGNGYMYHLADSCECADCIELQCGATRAGAAFWADQLVEQRGGNEEETKRAGPRVRPFWVGIGSQR